MLHVWRLFKRKYAASAFTGEGARLVPGRWNSKGVALVYASQSAALAVLEMYVNLDAAPPTDDYCLAEATFDESLLTAITAKGLPKNWRSYPAPHELRKIGDDWILSGKSAVLRVPSAIVELECNFLLNPAHPDFRKIKIGVPVPFRFDSRLMK